ncbi:MAG: glycosyltransferase family 4 protein, partial [SAR324 cluster bacterium]|nr:glycosyltransferase family 4 protein [SAR324 cluster bacterium]
SAGGASNRLDEFCGYAVDGYGTGKGEEEYGEADGSEGQAPSLKGACPPRQSVGVEMKLEGNQNVNRDLVVFVGSLKTGGAERAILNMVKRFPHDLHVRCRILLLCKDCTHELQNQISIPVESLGASGSISAYFALRKWLKRNRITCMQAHLVQCIIIGGLAAWNHSIKFIPIIHSFGTWKQQPTLRGRLRILLEKLVCRKRADRIIYVSNRVRQMHEEHYGYPKQKGEVIANILDDSEVVLANPGAGKCLRLISVGRVEKVKGFDWVLKSKSIRSLLNQGLEWTIVGDGSHLAAIKGLAQGLSGVHFTGRRTDVHELLKSHDVFFMPSLSEGLSVALLEACRSGLPLLATRVGSNDEVVEDGRNGRLIEPMDETALVDILKELFDKALLQRYANASRELFLERYNPEQLMERMTSILRCHANKGCI